MLIMGAEATGEKWRDNYITPTGILKSVEEFSKSIGCEGYYDPCPKDPQEDGLIQTWLSGHTKKKVVYVNPPFSKYSTWLQYGINEYNRSGFHGQPIQLIYICNTTCEVKWYREALNNANVELRTNHRVKFIDPRTMEPATNPRCSNTFFYFGENKYEFIKAFSKYGYAIDLDVWRAQVKSFIPEWTGA